MRSLPQIISEKRNAIPLRLKFNICWGRTAEAGKNGSCARKVLSPLKDLCEKNSTSVFYTLFWGDNSTFKDGIEKRRTPGLFQNSYGQP